ncbi:hypothetical protein SAMN05428642_102371 [Flaviramulus basaltis]|uniref:Cytochrome C and Quinol oxidase polypeptide I n=1 Tax=Flaviramulus basaltis TaxID=369401 RepID=A0A1K2IHX2_9FLAO|nr:hypothetical protein SAMN05428642_102371 [Flaviramulus basaltis]
MKLYKLYIYFWFTALTVLIIGLFYYNLEETIVINIYDTYFIIPSFHLTIFITFLLAFIGLIYFLHSKFEIPLFKFLSRIHTLVSISCIFLFYLSSFLKFKKKNDFPLFNQDNYLNHFIVSILITFICIQLIFIFNSLFSIILYYTKKNK